MAASWQTRYHESGHAFVAWSTDMLHSIGMILRSDTDAYTCVIENSDGSEKWCIKRAAVKLAGPLGRMLQQGQATDWNTMRSTGEYHTDFEEAVEIFRVHLNLQRDFGFDEGVEQLMNKAFAMALGFILQNQCTVATLADAAEGKDQLSRDEIIAVIKT